MYVAALRRADRSSNESYRLWKKITELQTRLRRDGAIVQVTIALSTARAAVTKLPERLKLKNLHC
jgi:hypothetical protein